VTVFSKRCSPLYRKMVGGVRQPKVRNLEKISKFLIPPLFTFFGRAGPPSAPGHHTTVASRRFDRRAPSPDRRLHYSVARPTGIAAARLAHQRPVRRLSSSAQVPSTAPPVLTRDGWPYPQRDSHTISQSLDCLPAHKSHRRHPPSLPRPDGHSARVPDTPQPVSRPARKIQVHRPPHPPSGRPADRHRPRQANPQRDTQASHRSSTRGFGSTRAAQGAAVPLSTDTSTRLSRSSGSQPAQSPTVSHPRPPDTREHPGRSHRTRTIVPTDSVLSHSIGGTPARCHRTRTTSTPPTRTRPESRTSPARMASHAEVRPLTRHCTASLDSHPARTARSPPDTRLLPLHAPVTRLDPTVPGPPPPHRLALDQSLALVPGRWHRTRRYVH